MAEYWIFGSSKPLGLSLTKAFRQSHKVTCFSRSVPKSEPDTVVVDFSDLSMTQRTISARFALAPPDGVVFCQRYRPTGTMSELAKLKAGLDVELAPVLAVIDAAKTANRSIRGPAKPLSLVTISSVAGIASHIDIALHYHLLKAVTISATRTLAAFGAVDGLRVNCVVLGEFCKHPREKYLESEKRKFTALEAFSLSGRLCTIPDIVDVVTFLLSEQANFISGQVLHLDGGLSSLSPESVVRTMLAVRE